MMVKSLMGQFLIAGEDLGDSNFARTVTLMIQHDADGAIGLVLNRPTPMTVEQIAEQVVGHPLSWDKPIFLGGPVEGPAFVLHTREDLADDEILPGLYNTLEADKLRECFRLQLDPCRVLAHYAGWGPGQLENEIAEGSWLSLPAEIDQVLLESGEELWRELLARVRRNSLDLAKLLKLSPVPADVRLN